MANLVTKDISLAHQMAVGIIGRSVMPSKTIEWESLSFCSDTNACGLTAENCSADPPRRLQAATEPPPVAEPLRNF